MPGTHARLAPSSAERWISCPASVRLIADLGVSGVSGSTFAAEGTLAHSLGELEVSLVLGRATEGQADLRRLRLQREAEVNGWDWVDMTIHVRAYVDLVLERAALYPNSQIMVEQRLDTGVPSCWGTSDIVILSPEHIEIIDLKYGAGLWVGVVSNPQLRLYALGALETFGDVLGTTETVRVSVFQPRLDNVATEELTAAEIRAWRETVIPIAEEALGDSAHFRPSDDACRFCPASGQCRAQFEWATARDFAAPADALSPEEIAEALEMLPAVKSWAAALEKAALEMAYTDQREIPGYKVVMSGGRRQVLDTPTAIERLTALGLEVDEVSKRSLRGIGELEQLLRTVLPKVGRRNPRLEDALGSLVSKSEGRPSLVPESDSRPAASPTSEAVKEFSE